MEKPSFWAIIPSVVLRDRTIPPTAKLILAEIYSLADGNGICYPSNSHFCQLLGISERWVIKLLNLLKEKGYIRCFQNEEKRYIQVAFEVLDKKLQDSFNEVKKNSPPLNYSSPPPELQFTPPLNYSSLEKHNIETQYRNKKNIYNKKENFFILDFDSCLDYYSKKIEKELGFSPSLPPAESLHRSFFVIDRFLFENLKHLNRNRKAYAMKIFLKFLDYAISDYQKGDEKAIWFSSISKKLNSYYTKFLNSLLDRFKNIKPARKYFEMFERLPEKEKEKYLKRAEKEIPKILKNEIRQRYLQILSVYLYNLDMNKKGEKREAGIGKMGLKKMVGEWLKKGSIPDEVLKGL